MFGGLGMKIIVIGAGKVGYTLAEHLTQEEHDVIVIDKDDEVIEHCSGSLDVICLKGNGANAKVLLEAGVDKANIVIASTESDESNMLACLIAKRLGLSIQLPESGIRNSTKARRFFRMSLALMLPSIPNVQLRSKSAGCCATLLPAVSNPLPAVLLKWLNSGHRKKTRSSESP